MIITCTNCKTRYNISDSAIKKKEISARCAKCKHVFTVRKSVQSTPVRTVENEELPIKIDGISASDSNMKAKIISVCNQKGGVAKTTTSLNLGVSLSLLKKRVLIIDFDIQANLTTLLGYKDAKSFFEVIHSKDAGISEYIIKTKLNLWLLPSNSKMALLAKMHLQDENFEYLLRDKLKSIGHYFDYIIIDTPPSGDFYTLNALLASDMAVIPTPCEYLSMQGVNHIVNMINVIREKSGHVINYKIPITMFEPENTASKVILKKLKEEYKDRVFSTMIEKDTKVQESQIFHTPTIYYDKESRAGRQYYNLAKEIINL
ncbi:MAG: zinc-ribbon domain-containing protein [Gammaproteobacteria bacterium]|nr:zinc-ribbon domain-containing protein [Gammaproteobacteria bacterium]MDH5734544.1 zinc-ribbon domain-containing protein [Gammaproteobacteria bacterium]